MIIAAIPKRDAGGRVLTMPIYPFLLLLRYERRSTCLKGRTGLSGFLPFVEIVLDGCVIDFA
jgi:hypothetical protein